MAYFLIADSVVVQKQPNADDGFIEGPEDVICGYVYTDGVFTAPLLPPAWSVPQSVSMRQARLAMLGAGILDAVDTAVSGLPDRAAQIEWDYATELRRDHPLIAQLGPALGYSDSYIDELFIAAAAIG